MKTRVSALGATAVLGLVIACFAGCGKEDDGGNPFGNGGSSGQTSTGGTGDGGTGDGGTTTESSDDGTGGGTGSSTSSSSSSSSGDTGTGSSTSSSSSSGDTGTGSSGTGGGAHGNPGDPYSHCMDDPNVCSPLTLCVNVLDADEEIADGFCTQTGCEDNGANCPPPPGGTATVTCLEVTVDGTPEQTCALDCSGGATCPTGMVCYNVGAEICF